MSVQATPMHVALSWHVDIRQIHAVTIERIGLGTNWIELRAFTGIEDFNFEDRDVVPGRSYRYRLKMGVAGQTSYSDEVAVSIPFWEFRLARVRPLLPQKILEVAYSLSSTMLATLGLFDIQGRRVASLRPRTTDLGTARHARWV